MNDFEISFFQKEHHNETLPLKPIEKQEAYLRAQEQTELLFDKTISLAFELSDYLIGTEKMGIELIRGKYFTGEPLETREKYFHAVTVILGLIYKSAIIYFPFEEDPEMKLIESAIASSTWTLSTITLTIGKLDKQLQNNPDLIGDTKITRGLITLLKLTSELYDNYLKLFRNKNNNE